MLPDCLVLGQEFLVHDLSFEVHSCILLRLHSLHVTYDISIYGGQCWTRCNKGLFVALDPGVEWILISSEHHQLCEMPQEWHHFISI